MISLFEIEDLVIDKLSKTKHKGRVDKYEALVKSAISMDAMGCDGRIMIDAELVIESALHDLSDENLFGFYAETEAGQEAAAQELGPACRESVVQDVVVEVLQHIAETVCSEARERISKKRKKAYE